MPRDRPHTPIQLGPFDLSRVLGTGGMADVWLGRHRRQGVDVAIKVVRSPDPFLVEALHNEVRAVAALRHPNVIWIHDYGVVPEDVAGLVPGTPWFAMELMTGPSLASASRRFTWLDCRRVLLALLAALGHAHAHGVVHRDIKPPNLLLGSQGRVKLTDFGIVLAREQVEKGGLPVSGGSPRYMAPEQFLRTWSEQGPWTDLYAVGCLAYSLCCGHPPFVERDLDRLCDLHWNADVPELKPRFDVPEGLRQWIGSLMAKRPADRPAFAADAALALEGLGRQPSTAAALPPPMPRDWREVSQLHPSSLAGAGMGLFGLRAVPAVGRSQERDALWRALTEVHGGAGPKAVVLRGPSGVGKSHLAHWLTRRAHELGVARYLGATHGPEPGELDGLVGMVARDVRAPGLPKRELELLLERLYIDLQGREDLLYILRPFTAEGVPVPTTRGQRWTAASAWLRHRGSKRPVVLWLDDAQWGVDSIEFAVAEVLAWDLPIVVVCTVRDDALAASPAATKALSALTRHARCEVLEVSPLPVQACDALIDVLLPLEKELHHELVRRTAGNPMFAIQLVGDWVERGVLRPGRSGFRQRRGATLEIPESLLEVWVRRVRHVLGGDRGWEHALRLAAVLGRSVSDAEWRSACAVAGVDPPEGLLPALLENRLATYDSAVGTWSFVHGMLRESILESAHSELPALHRACAVALSEVPRANARVGRHLVAAGAHVESLPVLLDGAFDHFEDGDLDQMEALLDEHDRSVGAAALAEDDERTLGSWNYRARLYYSRGDVAQAFRWWDRVVAACRRQGWSKPRMVALNDTALVLSLRAEYEAALERAREALEAARALDGQRHVADALNTLAGVALRAGGLDEAHETATAAMEIYRELDLPTSMFSCLIHLAPIEDARGDLSAARQRYRQMFALLERLDFRTATVRALSCIAEHHAVWGEWQAADEAMSRAVEEAAAIGGMRWPHMARLRHALILLRLRKDEPARALVEQSVDAGLPEGRVSLAVARLILGVDGPSFEARLQVVEEALGDAAVTSTVVLGMVTAAMRSRNDGRKEVLLGLAASAGARSAYRWPFWLFTAAEPPVKPAR